MPLRLATAVLLSIASFSTAHANATAHPINTPAACKIAFDIPNRSFAITQNLEVIDVHTGEVLERILESAKLTRFKPRITSENFRAPVNPAAYQLVEISPNGKLALLNTHVAGADYKVVYSPIDGVIWRYEGNIDSAHFVSDTAVLISIDEYKSHVVYDLRTDKVIENRSPWTSRLSDFLYRLHPEHWLNSGDHYNED